jgi:hypothetical protein
MSAFEDVSGYVGREGAVEPFVELGDVGAGGDLVALPMVTSIPRASIVVSGRPGTRGGTPCAEAARLVGADS